MREKAKSIDYFRLLSVLPRGFFYPAWARENLSPPARRPHLFCLIWTRPEPPVTLHHPCPARSEQLFKKLSPPARHHGAPRGETRDPHTSGWEIGKILHFLGIRTSVSACGCNLRGAYSIVWLDGKLDSCWILMPQWVKLTFRVGEILTMWVEILPFLAFSFKNRECLYENWFK
jgi:hypothetical protein